MSAQLRMQDEVIRRDHAEGHGLPDHLARTIELRRRQAEAITEGVHWVWRHARRALARLLSMVWRERPPAANGKKISKTLGRASVAEALRRDRARLARLLRRFVLEPNARRRRRRIAIAQLRMLDDRLLADIGLSRGQIELAVDGMLARRDHPPSRPAAASVPAAEDRYELPLAA
jgi:uncharacterized protein YjiS (DUF1127 family)